MSQNGDNSSSQTSNQHVDLDLDKFSSPPSNKKLLCIAFVSFQSFAMVQLGAAIYAGSEAMLGDSIAMMVDALTYLFNLIAERQKEVYASKLQQQNKSSCAITPFTRSRMVLKYRKYTYQLELIPPVLSIATLLIVIGLVMKEAVHTLILDFQRDASLQSDPNVNLMMGFSVFNLILDLVNVGCFASASHALGYKTDPAATDDPNDGDETDKATNKTHEVDERVDASAKNDSENDCDYDPGETKSDGFSVEAPYDAENRSLQLHDYDDRFRGDKVGDSTNLNMCSAYTHVFADTLRSFAVILASLLAKFTNVITSEVADAAAAVIVSVLILLSLVPLLIGMIQTFKSLNDINCLLKEKESNEDEEEEAKIELLRLA